MMWLIVNTNGETSIKVLGDTGEMDSDLSCKKLHGIVYLRQPRLDLCICARAYSSSIHCILYERYNYATG